MFIRECDVDIRGKVTTIPFGSEIVVTENPSEIIITY